MLTLFKPTVVRIAGTNELDAYVKPGDPLGLKHLCPALVKRILELDQHLCPLESRRVTLAAKLLEQ